MQLSTTDQQLEVQAICGEESESSFTYLDIRKNKTAPWELTQWGTGCLLSSSIVIRLARLPNFINDSNLKENFFNSRVASLEFDHHLCYETVLLKIIPGPSSISIILNLVRNGNTWAPFQIHSIRNSENEANSLRFIKPFKCFCCTIKIENSYC